MWGAGGSWGIPHGVGVCRARSRGVFRLRGKRKDIRGGLSRRIRTAWYMEGEVKVTCRVGRRVARGRSRTAWVFAGCGRGVLERGGAEGGVAHGGEVKVSRRAGFAAKVFRHTDGATGRSPGTGRGGEGVDGRMDGAGAWMRCKGGHRRRLRETVPNFV